MFRLKNIFKKKEREETIDFDPAKIKKEEFNKYRIKINLKSMCLFEQLAHKSFLSIDSEEDLAKILYATLVVNNPEFSTMTLNVFDCLIEDEVFLLCMVKKYEKESKYIQQFNEIISKNISESNEGDGILNMTDVASTLIIKYGMDSRYVMYEMELWEIAHYYKTVETMEKEKMEYQRLWSFINIMPHIDSKKMNSPQQLIKFPWEEDTKQKAMELNTKSAVSFLGKSAKKETDNGTE